MPDPSLGSASRQPAPSAEGDTPAPPEPVESRLVALLDPESLGCLPRILSAPRSNSLNLLLERSVDILCARKKISQLVVSNPVHDDGILAALGEAFSTLYPSLTQKRLMRSPASSWSTLCRRDVNFRRGARRSGCILIMDQFEEIFRDEVAEADRIDFVTNLANLAGHRSTTVLLVLQESKMELAHAMRALRPSFSPRFHLHLGTSQVLDHAPERIQAAPPRLTTEFRPDLQPIRPRSQRAHGTAFRASA